jgi:hypothetical protein
LLIGFPNADKDNTEIQKHISQQKGTDFSVADMVPGDWVYFQNPKDYANPALRKPTAPIGPWSGENALFMGTYAVKGEKKVPRFSGLGLYDFSEAGMKERLKAGYDKEMVAANMKDGMARTANVKDIKMTFLLRPKTGE